MPKTCVYCKGSIDDNSVVDVCESCGINVWGRKMFKAIVDNMENARERGNLNQGLVTEGMFQDIDNKKLDSKKL